MTDLERQLTNMLNKTLMRLPSASQVRNDSPALGRRFAVIHRCAVGIVQQLPSR
jgi:hypothetical protein